MTTQFTSGLPTQAAASLEAQLTRTLASVPPFLRLPKAGTRCPYTQLSRTSLSELVTPTRRNGGKPPVQARCQRAHRHAQRGIWLIPAESLFRYLLGVGTVADGSRQVTNRFHDDESVPLITTNEVSGHEWPSKIGKTQWTRN